MSLDQRNGRDERHPLWPSIDHLEGLLSTEVAIESRLVNDMKGILSEAEFKRVVGHLADSMEVEPRRLKTLRVRRHY